MNETRFEGVCNAIGYIACGFGGVIAVTMRDPTSPLMLFLSGIGILIVVRLQQIIRLLNR